MPSTPKHKHVWTPIALENGDDLEGRQVWHWCIRCGCLRLGSLKFHPGPEQKLTIVSTKR